MNERVIYVKLKKTDGWLAGCVALGLLCGISLFSVSGTNQALKQGVKNAQHSQKSAEVYLRQYGNTRVSQLTQDLQDLQSSVSYTQRASGHSSGLVSATQSAGNHIDGGVSGLKAIDLFGVEWGDTLSGISSQTGVSVDALAQQNQIQNVDLIYADSVLQIPK